MSRIPNEGERLLKMAEAVEAEGQPAALPVQIMFPSYAINVLRGMDPVSGRRFVNMVISSGNGAMQVVVPMDTLMAGKLGRDLSNTDPSLFGGNGQPEGEGEPA